MRNGQGFSWDLTLKWDQRRKEKPGVMEAAGERNKEMSKGQRVPGAVKWEHWDKHPFQWIFHVPTPKWAPLQVQRSLWGPCWLCGWNFLTEKSPRIIPGGISSQWLWRTFRHLYQNSHENLDESLFSAGCSVCLSPEIRAGTKAL